MTTNKNFLLLLLMFVVTTTSAQVTFILDSIPEYTPADRHLFLAGNLNGWNPGDSTMMLRKNSNGLYEITLDAQSEGTELAFKFTLGSWETVEKGRDGEEIENRVFTFGNGDTVHTVVYNWRNDGGGSGSTAAENVYIVSNDFFMPQLNRTRRIWIYLPPGYDDSNSNYPVMYMHDGQNLFDQQTSYAGEWEVDETLNALAEGGVKVPIVVGIDNGGTNRIDEYTPWSNPQYGGGEGEAYMNFLVETLKPYIDQHYRTLPDRENTAIMGSSLGGLISHYGAVRYQNIFSKAGIFSPSYWFADSVYSFTEETGKQHDVKFYLMCGDHEGSTTVQDMNNMATLLVDVGFDSDDVTTDVIAGGQHNEKLWREQFQKAYLWLFSGWINAISEKRIMENLNIYPNPVEKLLQFPNDIIYGNNDSLLIFDATGKTLLEIDTFKGQPVSVCGLNPGIYFFRLKTDTIEYSGQFIKR